MFCTDKDLLRWEPHLFKQAAFASQTLLSGTGDLAGTVFTIDAGSLAASHVASDMVLVLQGLDLDGSYPIVSIDSDVQMTVSVFHDPLLPDEGMANPAPVATGLDYPFWVRTFSPQIRVVTDLLKHASGIVPGTATQNATVTNPSALRRPCVLGTLQMIYNALAAAAATPDDYLIRSELYERLYRKALRSTQVALDLDGDGKADAVRSLNVMELTRS